MIQWEREILHREDWKVTKYSVMWHFYKNRNILKLPPVPLLGKRHKPIFYSVSATIQWTRGVRTITVVIWTLFLISLPMKVDMDMERRARHRDKTDVFAEESEALDQIAKQVNIYINRSFNYLICDSNKYLASLSFSIKHLWSWSDLLIASLLNF